MQSVWSRCNPQPMHGCIPSANHLDTTTLTMVPVQSRARRLDPRGLYTRAPTRCGPNSGPMRLEEFGDDAPRKGRLRMYKVDDFPEGTAVRSMQRGCCQMLQTRAAWPADMCRSCFRDYRVRRQSRALCSAFPRSARGSNPAGEVYPGSAGIQPFCVMCRACVTCIMWRKTQLTLFSPG